MNPPWGSSRSRCFKAADPSRRSTWNTVELPRPCSSSLRALVEGLLSQAAFLPARSTWNTFTHPRTRSTRERFRLVQEARGREAMDPPGRSTWNMASHPCAWAADPCLRVEHLLAPSRIHATPDVPRGTRLGLLARHHPKRAAARWSHAPAKPLIHDGTFHVEHGFAFIDSTMGSAKQVWFRVRVGVRIRRSWVRGERCRRPDAQPCMRPLHPSPTAHPFC